MNWLVRRRPKTFAKVLFIEDIDWDANVVYRSNLYRPMDAIFNSIGFVQIQNK